jgi:GTP cyclohydrolase I
MYQEILSGYAENPHQVVGNALFPVSTSQVVTIKEIQFCSTCEHHLLPFFGTVNIAYIPDKHVIGLSKLPRLVKIFSNRLQLQERLGEELSSAIDEILQPKGLLCEIRAMHLCVKMRGIKSTSSEMVTRVAKGEFATNPLARQEARELWR